MSIAISIYLNTVRSPELILFISPEGSFRRSLPSSSISSATPLKVSSPRVTATFLPRVEVSRLPFRKEHIAYLPPAKLYTTCLISSRTATAIASLAVKVPCLFFHRRCYLVHFPRKCIGITVYIYAYADDRRNDRALFCFEVSEYPSQFLCRILSDRSAI